MIDNEVTTKRRNILDMIVCRYDYGHANQITDHFFWGLLGKQLSDEEIEEYSRDLEAADGYGEEDYDAVHGNLSEWRNSRPSEDQ